MRFIEEWLGEIAVLLSTLPVNQIFSATNTKFKVSVVILYCYDNNKQLQQLKTSFKKKIYWNQYTRNLQVYDTS